MNNTGHIILQIIILLLLEFLLNLYRNELDKKALNQRAPNNLHKIVIWLDNKLNLVFFAKLALAVHIDFVMAALVNFKNFSVFPSSYFANSVIALFVVVLYLVLIFTVVKESLKLEKNRIQVFSQTGETEQDTTNRLEHTTENNKKSNVEYSQWTFLKNDVKGGRLGIISGCVD